jgi:hypothetical protein
LVSRKDLATEKRVNKIQLHKLTQEKKILKKINSVESA